MVLDYVLVARNPGDRQQPVVRSDAVRLRCVAGAMEGVVAGQAHAATEPRDGWTVCACLDVQAECRDAGAGARRHSRRPIRSNAWAALIWARRASIAGGRGARHAQSARRLKNSCEMFFYQVAKKTGIDPIAAMGHRLRAGHGTGDRSTERAPRVCSPTREWREGEGQAWNLGDTVVAGIATGLHPGLAAGTRYVCGACRNRPRAVLHLTCKLAGDLQSGSPASGDPVELTDRYLGVVREGMWAVVKEAGATRCRPSYLTSAGRWPARLVRPRCAAWRARVAPGDQLRQFEAALGLKAPPACSVRSLRPYDALRYAPSVVVEQGNAGAAAAGPIARDIMMDTLQRDPGGRDALPAAQVGC